MRKFFSAPKISSGTAASPLFYIEPVKSNMFSFHRVLSPTRRVLLDSPQAPYFYRCSVYRGYVASIDVAGLEEVLTSKFRLDSSLRTYGNQCLELSRGFLLSSPHASITAPDSVLTSLPSSSTPLSPESLTASRFFAFSFGVVVVVEPAASGFSASGASASLHGFLHSDDGSGSSSYEPGLLYPPHTAPSPQWGGAPHLREGGSPADDFRLPPPGTSTPHLKGLYQILDAVWSNSRAAPVTVAQQPSVDTHDLQIRSASRTSQASAYGDSRWVVSTSPQRVDAVVRAVAAALAVDGKVGVLEEAFDVLANGRDAAGYPRQRMRGESTSHSTAGGGFSASATASSKRTSHGGGGGETRWGAAGRMAARVGCAPAAGRGRDEGGRVSEKVVDGDGHGVAGIACERLGEERGGDGLADRLFSTRERVRNLFQRGQRWMRFGLRPWRATYESGVLPLEESMASINVLQWVETELRVRNDLGGSAPVDFEAGRGARSVYDGVAAQQRVCTRVESLEKRISTLHSHLSVHVDAHHASHGAHLERIIIVLIAVEIGLAILHHGSESRDRDDKVEDGEKEKKGGGGDVSTSTGTASVPAKAV